MCRELQLGAPPPLPASGLNTAHSTTWKVLCHWRPSCNSESARECGQSSGGASDHFVRYSGSSTQAEVLPPSPARGCVLTLLRSDDPSDRRAEQRHRIPTFHDSAVNGNQRRNDCVEEQAGATGSASRRSSKRPDPGASGNRERISSFDSVDPGSTVREGEKGAQRRESKTTLARKAAYAGIRYRRRTQKFDIDLTKPVSQGSVSTR
jgi:hypothetical protein